MTIKRQTRVLRRDRRLTFAHLRGDTRRDVQVRGTRVAEGDFTCRGEIHPRYPRVCAYTGRPHAFIT